MEFVNPSLNIFLASEIICDNFHLMNTFNRTNLQSMTFSDYTSYVGF